MASYEDKGAVGVDVKLRGQALVSIDSHFGNSCCSRLQGPGTSYVTDLPERNFIQDTREGTRSGPIHVFMRIEPSGS